MTEREWQDQVLELAELLGWFPYHTYDSRRSRRGFPDLVLVRERVVFAELKREGKRPTTEQSCWLHLLHAAGQEAYLWRPSDFGQVREVLTSRLPRPGQPV